MTTNTLRIIRFSVTPIAMIAITANKAKKSNVFCLQNNNNGDTGFDIQ